MGIKIVNDNREILFTDDTIDDNTNHSDSRLVENNFKTTQPFWETSVQNLFFPGTKISSHQIKVLENIHVSTNNVIPMPGLIFVQRGKMTARVNQKTEFQSFSSSQHNLLFNPYATDYTTFKKQNQLELFIVSFTPERFLQLAEGSGGKLEQVAENIASEKSFLLTANHNLNITARMYEIIGEIRSCAFHGGIKKLYIQSKTLELVALQFDQFDQLGKNGTVLKLSKADLNKIHHAHEFLIADFQNPPSLRSLSREAGLNEFKLKSGFKQVYKYSVMSYLNNYRLTLAREQLLNREKSVSEIAFEYGYSSPQHFSLAFKKKFGLSPVKLR